MQTKERPFVEGYDDPMQPRHARVIRVFPVQRSRKKRAVGALISAALFLVVCAFWAMILYFSGALEWGVRLVQGA